MFVILKIIYRAHILPSARTVIGMLVPNFNNKIVNTVKALNTLEHNIIDKDRNVHFSYFEFAFEKSLVKMIAV